nr:hypothetical transcript [Hymenolepis microstoma]
MEMPSHISFLLLKGGPDGFRPVSLEQSEIAGVILTIHGINNVMFSPHSRTNEQHLWLELCYVAGGVLAVSTPFVNAYGYAKNSVKMMSNNCKIVCPVSFVVMFTAMVGMNYPGYWGWSTAAIITAIFNMLGALGTTLLMPAEEDVEPFISPSL